MRTSFFRGALCSIALLLFLAALAWPAAARAASFDPGAGWKTISTPHFRVHFPERIDLVARRAARILEEVYPEITGKWKWKPWSITEVVLVDTSDEANGLSSVLPYNWMLIYTTPPLSDSSLAHYDDWFRMLLVHEFTHIVQLDAVAGFWRPFRIVLGKTVAPSGINPTWFREGVSQIAETDLTAGGRGRGAYSEMVVRTAVVEGRFPAIDEADGLGWKWPSHRAAYVYGIKFLQYLVDTYGEEKLLEFDRRVRSSPLLTMINHQARVVYGKTFYELWREWETALEERYGAQRAKVEGQGLTPLDSVVEVGRDEQFAAPALSPDGTRLAYTVASPHREPQIRVKELSTGEERVIKKGQEAIQLSWSRDGTRLVWASLGSYKRYYRYYDLWLHDFSADEGKGRTTRVTSGQRARDPEFDLTGASVLFIEGEQGTDQIKRVDLETKEITTLTPYVPQGTQFANPRLSPDGRFLALSIWKPGEGWRVHRCETDGSGCARLTRGQGLDIESRPAWSPDGKFIVYASDESGISNLYRAPASGGSPDRVTNVLGGVFQPSLVPDGTVLAQFYTAQGYRIGRFTPAPTSAPRGRDRGKRGGLAAAATGTGIGAASRAVSPGTAAAAGGSEPARELSWPSAADQIEASFLPRKYVSFGQSLFLPRFFVPSVGVLDNAVFASLATGGGDPLRWQNWMAGATYRTDARYLGYFASYWYNRFLPVFGASASGFAVDFGDITFVTYDNTGNIASTQTVHFFEKRHAVSAYMLVPIQRHSVGVSYFFEDHQPKTNLTAEQQAALNLGHFAGFRAEYRYGDAKRFPASISSEDGRQIRLTGSITNKHLGSGDRNEQVIFSGDWREFVHLARHQVLALRAAGGMTWGDRLVQGTFGLGGALGEGSFGGGGSYNYFPLRGLPVSALSRTRAMLFSSEYRFPLLNALRGLGTVPLFLKDIDGALFVDYGNAWNAHEYGSDGIRDFFDNFLMGVGAELRGNFIVGHGLPMHGRLGYGIIVMSRDRLGTLADPILGTNVKYGTLILALGAAF